MNKLERVNKIIEAMESQNIKAYEIAKHTSLTPKEIQKTKDKATENPRITTLNEIESYLGISTNTGQTSSITNKDILNDEDLVILSHQVKKNWNRLLQLEDFKTFFFYQIAKSIDMQIEDIFAVALNKRK
ncbi:hypothetical protein ACJRPK_13695 [Aquimarina sp. 2-A2]|uniref:hypothetical protein n=1 Tax=Aquimarina sp. 2-A2 TaxID=3382644 RepID=UPI00387F13D7